MSRSILLFLFLFTITSSIAKDVSITVQNDNDVDVMLMVGSIPSKENYYSDDELVANSKNLGIVPFGRSLKAGKKTQVNKKDLAGNQILVVFGLFDGGGRTEVFRYAVKDIDGKFTILFERTKIYKPSNSFYSVIMELQKTENLGDIMSIGDNRITGIFLFYNILSETYPNMYVIIPPGTPNINKSEFKNNEVSDLLRKDATTAYMGSDGKIIKKIPEGYNESFYDIIFPGYSKIESIFGSASYKYLTWNIVNTGDLGVSYKESSFLTMLNSCSETDKKFITNKLYAQINKDDTSEYHLFYIVAVHRSDSIIITESEMDALDESEQLIDGDISTGKGNYRLNGKTKVVFNESNVVNNVKAIDVTPLLYYKVATESTFKNTEYYADNYLGVYRLISNYIELPELDMETISLSNPAKTNSTIKQTLKAPEILQSIEKRLVSDDPIMIPIGVLSAADKKLDAKKK